MAKSETSLPQELLDILVCPVDHAKVRVQDEGRDGDRLVCEKCGRAYPVRDGIPIMLVDEAEMTRK